MKESPRRYINPFLSDEENAKVNCEDENSRKSLAPSSVPSNSVEKAKQLYVDKNVTECEPPELITYYEESSFHVVKDICVDEGLSNREKNESDKEHHNLSCNPIILDGDKHDNMIKVDLGIQILKHEHLISSPLEDCDKNANLLSVTKDSNVPSKCASDELKQFVQSEYVQSKVNLDPDNTIQTGEGKLESNFNSSTEQVVSGSVLEPFNNCVNDVDQQLSEAKSAESGADKSSETKVENATLNFDIAKPAIVTGPHEPPLDTQSAPNHHEMAPDNITVSANQLQGGDESCFPMVVPDSGLIMYSGPVASAGSISHRSDGSNTSVRSFAFPILQNEWNSSPIRMAKADRRHSRKHRGWSQVLMCCRF